jgi:hypothetical protein
MKDIDWQPLVNTAARWFDGYLFTFMIFMLFIVLLWGRERTARWVEAIGWKGIVELVQGMWSAVRGQPMAYTPEQPKLIYMNKTVDQSEKRE